MRALIGATLALLSVSCFHTHLPRNAPGNIDLYPSHQPSTQNPSQPPRDPGEQHTVFSAGPSGAGALSSKSGDPGSKGAFGAEASLYYGTQEHSHDHDSPTESRGPALPVWYTGLNVGFQALWREPSWGNRIYTEVQYSHLLGLVGIAGGWQVTDLERHGPQFTLNLGPIYARSATNLGSGTNFEMGAMFKIPWMNWVFSR